MIIMIKHFMPAADLIALWDWDRLFWSASGILFVRGMWRCSTLLSVVI